MIKKSFIRVFLEIGCLSIALLVLSSSNAQAQNFFFDLSRSVVSRYVKSMVGTKHNKRPKGSTQLSPQTLGVMDNFRATGGGGSTLPAPGTSEYKEKAFLEVQPGKGRHASNMLLPMAGFMDTMNSQVHADQLSVALSSPVTLYNTTMLLTEPGVAGGLQNAAMYTFGSLSSRYQAEDAFMKRLDANPDTKEMVLRAYDECIADVIRLRNSRLGAGWNDDDMDSTGWIEAQSFCMGDRLLSVKQTVGATAKEFDDINGDRFCGPGGTGPFCKERGFDFVDDPAHQNWLQSGTTRDKNVILLSDYLFNQTNWEGIGLTAAEIDFIKAEFVQLLGDYEFRLDTNKTTAAGIQMRSSSRELKYNRILPTKSHDEYVRDQFVTVYSGIMNMLVGLCTLAPGQGDEPMQEAHLFCRENGPVGDHMRFVELSANGFQFDCAMLDMLMLQFKIQLPDIMQNPATCQLLNPAPGGFSNPFELPNRPNDIKNGHHTVAILACKIVLAQIYSVAMQINRVIGSLTNHGGLDNFVRRLSQQLLHSMVPSDNYMVDYRDIIDSINLELAPAILADAAKSVGEGAAVISNEVATDMANTAVGGNISGGSSKK